MSDALSMENLEFWTHIGAAEDERRLEQRLLVSISLELRSSPAGKADDLRQTIDYAAVREAILSLRKEERHIIEHLAEDVASAMLRKFRPEHVSVTVKKFPFGGAQGVSITITRP